MISKIFFIITSFIEILSDSSSSEDGPFRLEIPLLIKNKKSIKVY